jgi:peptide/nickel transport system substrate-binding protein
MKHLKTTGLVAAGLALGLIGLGAAVPANAATGSTLTILSSQSAQQLDPAKSQNLSTTFLGLIYRRLTTWQVTKGHAAKVVPDLATNTGVPSDGGKTWTYTLKKGIKFQDGSPITSADIKYGVERSFAPQLSGGLSYHKSLLVGGDSYQGPYSGQDLASIATPNSSTIVFHLNAAYGDWPWIASMPAFAPVPKSADTDPATYGAHPVASGPYEVASVQQGTQITLKRNPNWSKSTDKVRTASASTIIYKMSQDDSTSAQTIISDAGSAQTSFDSDILGAAELAQVKQNGASTRVATSEAGPIQYLAMNTQKGALKNLKVRQALEYAVSKQSYIIASGGSQAASPASTLITPGIAGRKAFNLYKAPENGNVAKAKSLLKSAGAKNLDLTLLTPNDSSSLAQAQALQEGIQRAGVKVTLKQEDSDSFYTDATTSSDYDLVLYSWQPDFPSANSNIQPLYASSQIGNGGNNVSHYSNPKVDALIAKASAQTDQKKAQSLWAEADEAIMKDAPVVPLTYAKQSFIRGSKISNFFIADFPAYPNYLTLGVGK